MIPMPGPVLECCEDDSHGPQHHHTPGPHDDRELTKTPPDELEVKMEAETRVWTIRWYNIYFIQSVLFKALCCKISLTDFMKMWKIDAFVLIILPIFWLCSWFWGKNSWFFVKFGRTSPSSNTIEGTLLWTFTLIRDAQGKIKQCSDLLRINLTILFSL